ncbi:winged helix-turn-helix domain-containing protein [uncultured Paludibaculum sp.]|uniref:winged helix-turn-helix domain-containing protein n=1 Tax=uncultured Paludibaculum sp. TaxID=1765020 RepID=UPI002AAB56C0|nr:winged helix-turn-helix domain-containing protein [uncultured Paludibaculum sp.]
MLPVTKDPWEASADRDSVIKFGPFAVDVRTGELTKGGIRIRLGDQPFRILVTLLRSPGELVTRDELRQVIWGDDVAGDFEQGLNRSVNKVREALRDTAVNPRYVETLPGRGYRFIGTIEQEPAAIDQPRAHRPSRLMLALAAVGLAVAGCGYLVWRFTQSSIPEVRWRKLTTDNYDKFPPVLSDGSRLYYLAGYRGEKFIAQLTASGGPPLKLPITLPGPDCALHDLSPDGEEVLLTATSGPGRSKLRPLWSLRIADGTARRVGSILATSAAFAPEGRQIVFSTESELYLTTRNGASPQRILELKDSLVDSVEWSPHGDRIRFSRRNPLSAQSAAWEVRTDGSGLRRLAPGWDVPSFVPAGWTSSGKYGIFAAGGNFWAMQEAGILPTRAGHLTKLTTDEPEFASFVRPRSDLRFHAIGIDRLGELQKYDAASKSWVAVLDGISAEQAEYARDGQRIAYVSYPQRTLWVRQADGTRPIQFTSPPMVPMLPRWSPDGRRVAFAAQEAPDKPMRAYLLDTDTGATRPAVPSDPGSQCDPTWSPDGKKLLYGLSTASARERVYLKLADLATGKVSKFDGSDGLFSPRWSPDGSMVVALRWGGSRSLMLYRFRDRRWVQLSDDYCRWPVWSPDGKSIVYVAGNSLMRYRIDGNRKETIAELPPGELGGFSRGIGISSDGAPMKTLDHNSPQVYQLEFAQQ